MKAAQNILTGNNLSATVSSSIVNIGEEREVRLTFTALITATLGSGTAPSSTPVGTWALLFSFDNIEYYPIGNADVVTEMSRLNTTGNNLIRAAAIIHHPPGNYVKATYTRGSGGGAGANCELWLEVAK